ncbi:MAG TPA: ABC transporter permease subunit, partial [Coriobacteriia bacterium]
MWGIFVIVPLLQKVEPWIQSTPLGRLGLFSGPPIGIGILPAGIILALMVLPFITAVSRDVLGMVPTVVKEAGFGMGSTTFEVTRRISFRYALSGIAGAVFLGLGRALGETMAVAFLLGGVFDRLPHSLLDQGTSISATIALQFGEATKPLDVSALIELGLILFLITMVFQLVAQVWLARARRMTGSRA